MHRIYLLQQGLYEFCRVHYFFTRSGNMLSASRFGIAELTHGCCFLCMLIFHVLPYCYIVLFGLSTPPVMGEKPTAVVMASRSAVGERSTTSTYFSDTGAVFSHPLVSKVKLVTLLIVVYLVGVTHAIPGSFNTRVKTLLRNDNFSFLPNPLATTARGT